jgi:hypothetical protein
MKQKTPLWLSLFFLIGSIVSIFGVHDTFEKYILEKNSQYFRKTTVVTKVGESIERHGTGSRVKRVKHYYYSPCVVVTVDNHPTPIKACKKFKTVLREHLEKEDAQRLLQTTFASTAHFPIYVSDDYSHAFLDPYTPQNEAAEWFDFLMLVGLSSVFCLLSFFSFFNPKFLHRKKKKKASHSSK